MSIQIKEKCYEWAKEEALKAWLDHEGAQHERMLVASATSAADLQWFKDTLVIWKVSRTIRGEGKSPLFQYIIQQCRQPWLAAAPGTTAAFKSVEELAQTAQDEGWSTGGLPTSMASKVAFLCNPRVFTPYDSYARVTMNDLGFAAPVNRFALFMGSYQRCFDSISERLLKDGARLARTTPPRLSAEVAAMRILDKYLMCVGGFGA